VIRWFVEVIERIKCLIYLNRFVSSQRCDTQVIIAICCYTSEQCLFGRCNFSNPFLMHLQSNIFENTLIMLFARILKHLLVI
jgi:hypothetical protein